MGRIALAFISLLMLPFAALGQAPLAGTYRLVSVSVEIDGEPVARTPLGKAPKGYVVMTGGRWINFFTAEGRKFGASAEEKAKLWDTLIGYTGPYRIEGNKLIVTVEVSWNETWNGTEQVRYWQLEGNRLSIVTAREPYGQDPSKMRVARVVLEKVD